MRDADVRKAVLANLECLHAGDANTRIVQEMGIWSGAVRIDIAVINGELVGIELKSDRDTLGRLPKQVEYYGRVFDRMTLVVGSRLAKQAREIVPKWWGITIAYDKNECIRLVNSRKARKNPGVDPFLVAKLLWKEEAINILEKYQLAKGWRSKSADMIHSRLAVNLPISTLTDEVRSALKRRHGWLGQTVRNERNVSV